MKTTGDYDEGYFQYRARIAPVNAGLMREQASASVAGPDRPEKVFESALREPRTGLVQ